MIIAFNSFLLFTFALGQAVTYYGTLRISRVVGKPTPGQVSVDKKVVYVGDYPTTFEYSQTGALKKYGNEMHLGIGDSGELIMTETPHGGFHLSPTKNFKILQEAHL
ncbi:hypothetical protein JCM33374_g1679 [Metschnikowia sp. JCM 33374]|nr:hypothetical protein JCM33374_g1679 [Metschnikowia sp. JCM 33374]